MASRESVSQRALRAITWPTEFAVDAAARYHDSRHDPVRTVPEGINLFIAGRANDVAALRVELRALPGLTDLAPKESWSTEQPVNRMLVKIKKEIIPFGVAGIDPARRPAPKLAPRLLKQWLDEGRPVTLLDTRNGYEVRLGTFAGAIDPQIDHFRKFPDAVRRLPAALKAQPIVMFCTGGIRCEKAAPLSPRGRYICEATTGLR